MPLILGTNSIKDTGYDVANSCRFFDNTQLKRTNGSPTNAYKGTFSAWVKRSALSSTRLFQNMVDGNNYAWLAFNSSHQLEVVCAVSGSTYCDYKTNRLFRDVSAWLHIVVEMDTTEGTATNRMKFYVNGVQETSFATQTFNGSQNSNHPLLIASTTNYHTIGASEANTLNLDGYMTEVVLLDGQALDPTSFGEFDSNSPNIWKPIDVSGLTFGNNGYYLDFEKDGSSTGFVDSSSNARAITVTGNVHHSFDQAKFNESSIEFDGTNDSLDIADSTDFDFGTGNFTFEFFAYKQTSGKMSIFETRSSSNNNGFNLEFSSANKFEWYDTSIASGNDLPGDPSAISLNTWTHYAVVRNGSSCKMYRDGTEVGTAKDVGSNSQVSAGTPTIGESAAGAADYDGYLDEIRLSNVARYTGNFTAPTSPFTSDSNTVLLIQSKASNLIGADVSGEGNHFESSGITSEDQSTDTCTNNYSTINSLDNHFYNATLSEGNLKQTCNSSNYSFGTNTFGVSQGKWVVEVKIESGSTVRNVVGITDKVSTGTTNELGSLANGWQYSSGGNVYNNGSDIGGSYDSFTTNDIIGIYLDLDNNKLYFSKNGSVQNSGTGISITAPSSTTNGVYFFAFGDYGASDDSVNNVNFGSPAFSISSGNTDGEYGNFEYTTTITGDSASKTFKALNTKNLAEFG